MPLQSFTDGLQTILVTESTQRVQWTCPEDIPYRPGGGRPDSMRGVFPNELRVGLADGFVKPIALRKTRAATIEAAITRNAGDKLDDDW